MMRCRRHAGNSWQRWAGKIAAPEKKNPAERGRQNEGCSINIISLAWRCYRPMTGRKTRHGILGSRHNPGVLSGACSK